MWSKLTVLAVLPSYMHLSSQQCNPLDVSNLQAAGVSGYPVGLNSSRKEKDPAGAVQADKAVEVTDSLRMSSSYG